MTLAVETTNLSKSFGPVRAVDSVDLRVGQGEIYGFLGLNGAGKTTTIRALLGMIRPNAGSVKVLGQVVGPYGRGPWRRVGHRVERPAVAGHAPQGVGRDEGRAQAVFLAPLGAG